MRPCVRTSCNGASIAARDSSATVEIPGAFCFDAFKGRGAGYRIFVYCPQVSPPPSGFPVMYVLDGNATFGTAVDTVALQMKRTKSTGVPPCIIVGIGYPTPDLIDIQRRQHDYTPAGAPAFSDFVENELKPALQARLPIDPEMQALFGHSLGGLYTVWSLFTRPHTFRSYMAASPSFWWNDRVVLKYEARFLRHLYASTRTPRLLVTAGSLEGVPPQLPTTAFARSMAEDAALMVARLRWRAGARLQVSFVELTDETHASVIPAAISRSVRFAWAT